MKNIFISVLFLLITISCAGSFAARSATTLAFDTEHPPEVDLRDVSRITIIPFEKTGAFKFEYFATEVTNAISNGLKNNALINNITFIEPQNLADIPKQDLWQYADVYITGRIVDVFAGLSNIRNSRHNHNRREYVNATVTVTVIIEYSYIRAKDGKILGTYNKKETAEGAAFFERPYDMGNQQYPSRGRGNNNRNHGADNKRVNQILLSGDELLQKGSFGENLAKLAIDNFSYTMSREIASWTTREKRKLKTPNDDVSAEYNAAILLAADNQYTEALKKLENIQNKFSAEGKTAPRYIGNEIKKMLVLANEYKILEEYRKNRKSITQNVKQPQTAASQTPEATSKTANSSNTREIKGIVNLNLVTVYALNEPITGSKDISVWSKITSSAESGTPEGRWLMRLPVNAPSSLWFVVSDGKSMYITKTAINTSLEIKLDTERMVKLE